MPYELKLEHYAGPLDKLLELVEGKKLEITLVNLAEVTGDFLNYLKKLEVESQNHVLIADFLTIASKLLLIKSKILIPSLALEEEETADIQDLEKRLKIYQEFKKAQNNIKNNWNTLPKMDTREFLMMSGPIFYPPKSLEKARFEEVLLKLTGELEKIFKPKGIIKNEIISLKNKIAEVLKRLTETPLGFRKIHGEKSKSELVVLFLAILHLIKDQLVYAEQTSHFDDIKIAKAPKIN